MTSEQDVIDLTRDPSPPPGAVVIIDAESPTGPETACIVISDDDSIGAGAWTPDEPRRFDSDLADLSAPVDADSDDPGWVQGSKSREALQRQSSTDGPRSEPKRPQEPSYRQTGEQPLKKRIFRQTPRWNPARAAAATRTEERRLPELDYKPADMAPVWVKNTTLTTSRKARLQQLRR